jgi:hypothetical protein
MKDKIYILELIIANPKINDLGAFYENNKASMTLSWPILYKVYGELSKDKLIDADKFLYVTEYGKSQLEEFKSEIYEAVNDKKRTRTKDDLDTKLTKWQVKTFWVIFVLSLFAGIYSAVDFVNSFKENDVIEKLENKIEKMEKRIITLEKD